MSPTISAVVGVYNAERWIGATLDSILGQTHAPDEVVVVDDGSTDETGAVLSSYGSSIRVVKKPNGGCPSAFNRAFGEARGVYVAMCGADDVWEPRKLEWQLQALHEHPDIDVAFGGAANFGALKGSWPAPSGIGILDRRSLIDRLYLDNFICASSILMRRALAQQLGPFVERFGTADDRFWAHELGMDDLATNPRFSGDDYDYWMRALKAGATFYYEPRRLVRYRRHENNVTRDSIWVQRSALHVRHWHADLVPDSLRRSVGAADLFQLGRMLINAGHARQARAAFLGSLRHRVAARGVAWALIASLNERTRQRLIRAIGLIKRSSAASSAA